MRVDLPAPFGPTRATRSPRSMWTLARSNTRTSPYAFATSRSSTTVLPLFALAGNLKCTRLRAAGTSIGVIFSSILTRLWTCFALVAL